MEGTAMAIITISRQTGSLGDEIAKSAADRLSFQHIEKSQISGILLKHGFSASDVDKYDEKKPSLLQNLSVQKNIYAHLIRAAVYELAARENVIIVGRGAQLILKDIPGTLHVRVIAPETTRVERLVNQRGYDEKKARWIIQQSDRDSSGYIRTYFDAKWDESDLYDMILNTRTLAMNTCVEMITRAVGTDEFRKGPHLSEKLSDLALAQKVKAVLLEVAGIEVVNLDIEKGVAHLSGSTISTAEKAKCEKIILNIKGVKKVNNQLNVLPEDAKIF